MDPTHDSLTATPTDAAWRQWEDLVETVRQLASGGSTPDEFARGLLAAVVKGTAAPSGAVWSPARNERWRCLAAHGRDRVVGDVAAVDRHEALRSAAEAVDCSVCCLAGAWVVLAPIRCDDQTVGLLEVAPPDSADAAVCEGQRRLLQIVAEAAAEFYLRRSVQSLKSEQARWRACDQFVRAAHASLDLDRCAAVVVNEGRKLLDADRVSLLASKRGRSRLLAISGVDVFDRRATAVRQLEALADVVLAGGEPLRYPDESGALAPQVEAAIDAHQDASHARRIVVLPLRAQDDPGACPLGAIVFEQFSSRASSAASLDLESFVAAHAECAVGNALRHSRTPGVRLWSTVERSRWFVTASRLPWTLVALAAGVAAVVALAMIPAELTVAARGQAQPAVRRAIFAPRAAIVDAVDTRHSAEVKSGDVLLRLRSPDLDYELARVAGELATIRQRLSTLSATRLGDASPTGARRDTAQQLAAEAEELRQAEASLERQESILREQEKQLIVRSPIDGRILTTWDELARLASRPVARGDNLLTVANVNGAWTLELDIPERDAGHVLEAARDNPSLEVAFTLATQPGQTHHGALDRLSPGASGEGEADRSVQAMATIPPSDAHSLRPGATVVAKIRCGRRSVGYVWLHRLWEELQRWTW